ncbi:MAG TPA: LamG domain-containing protein [Flavitalea sp.]|nr:LamG domain-containing protein [Flavitalea sp.]
MKLSKSVLALLPIAVFLLFAQTNFTSCQKETEIIRDTIIKKDTLIIKDTVRITDTVRCGTCYNLQDSLVAHYNFNGGNLNDSSGNNNHIVFSNASKTTDRFGKSNNAYLFDGASSYMKVANSTSLNPTNAISLMAIVKINDFYRGNCGANQIFGKGWNDFINGFYVLRFGSLDGCNVPVDTTREAFTGSYGNLNTRAGALNSSNFIHTNSWYNVVYTYSNGESKLYVNGSLIHSSNTTAVFTPNSQELYIGKHGDPLFPYLFKGIIDEIRIYKKALCEDEVKLLNALKD